MKPVLRALFKSDFFKKARYTHLKSPAEVVVGHDAPRGWLRAAEARLRRAVDAAVLHGPGSAESAVGRGLAHRPGVDQQRLADVAHQLRRRAGRQPDLPGVQGIINRLKAQGSWSRSSWSTNCLDLLGPVEVGDDTQEGADRAAKQWGQISWDNDASAQERR